MNRRRRQCVRRPDLAPASERGTRPPTPRPSAPVHRLDGITPQQPRFDTVRAAVRLSFRACTCGLVPAIDVNRLVTGSRSELARCSRVAGRAAGRCSLYWESRVIESRVFPGGGSVDEKRALRALREPRSSQRRCCHRAFGSAPFCYTSMSTDRMIWRISSSEVYSPTRGGGLFHGDRVKTSTRRRVPSACRTGK
jgi:hypothetical protein